MGYNNGPKIVTDRLGLYIDSGNIKSYPGTGTVWNDMTNNGLNFSGSASYITPLSGASAGYTWSTGTTNLLDTDQHSIFFRIRFNSTAGNSTGTTGSWEKIFTYAPATTDRSPGVWRWPSNRWIHWRYDPGNTGCDFGYNSITLDSNSEFPLNTWFYIGVTKNANETINYVNGKRIGAQYPTSNKTSGSSPIYIFEYYTNPLCNVDNMFIYNKVLTDSEVLQNYNALKGRLGLP